MQTTTRAPKLGHRIGTPDLVLIGLEVFLGVGALAGGYGLMANAQDGLGMGAALLDATPFTSYLLPGAMLFVVNGVAPLVVAAAAARGSRWPVRWGHLGVGVALTGWIFGQVALIGLVSWLQPAYLGYGLVLTTLALRRRRTA